MSTSTPIVLLFSYGTLQNRDVQIANFGRELTGREDTLPSYALADPVLSDNRSMSTSSGVPIRKMRCQEPSSKSQSMNWLPRTDTRKTLITTGFWLR
jgi:hypothetical protein